MNRRGHLDVDKNSIVGKQFKFYAYRNKDTGEFTLINTENGLKYMETCRCIVSSDDTVIVEGTLEIVEAIVDKESYMKKDGLYFGGYMEFNWNCDEHGTFYTPREPKLESIQNSLLGFNVCYQYGYKKIQDKGGLIGVVLKIVEHREL